METSYAKHAPALPVLLPDGTLIRLQPLSPSTIDRVWLDTKLELEAMGIKPTGLAYAILSARRTLELSCGVDLAFLLHQDELLAVVKAWGRHHQRCHPSESKLSTWLRKRINDDVAVLRDGWRAYRAKSASEYYGCPLVDLTDGQVAYWQLLTSAYAEFHVPDSKGRRKTATKEWLTKDDE